MKKYCKKCKLELPPGHNKIYCVGVRHTCWCSDVLNKWRIKNNIITNDDLVKGFNESISQHLILTSTVS